MKIHVPVKKIREDAKLPYSGSEYSAGYDLYACTGNGRSVIAPHTSCMIGTGLACAIPEGYFGALFARSGLAAKEGLRPANCVGVLDSDYRGEIMIALHNDTDSEKCVEDGERIAQLVVMPYLAVSFAETDELDETHRGDGGFGHTGKK
ncbi:MAG: dUTP diphosphatase [Lachnospiraceae bacterium]|nr:dUTP diphosphatase [Lachnospiraceae bacterium]